MSISSDVSAPKPPVTRSVGRGRWIIGVGILTIAVLAQAALWTHYAGDRTLSKMSTLYVWPAAIFALALWWTFFSAQPWRIRGAVWGAIGAMLVVLGGVYSFDGVDGEMIPRFRYRWQPSSKQAADEFFAKQKTAASPDQAVESSANATVEPWLASDGDWTGFRGPRRDGIVTGIKLRRDWNERPPKELWRHPVGLGWSSFAIVGEFAFTQEQRGSNESLVCYRLNTGEEVWVHGDPARLEITEANGGDGPHGTPEFHEGRLYSLGGTGLLNCLDAKTGRRLWQADILKDAVKDGPRAANIPWGMSGSPLVVDDLVIVSPGGEKDRSTIAYDRLSGEIVWAAGSYPASYASPQLATLLGVRQVLIFHGNGLSSHELATGRELWFKPWTNDPKVNSIQPVVLPDESVFFGNSYGIGSARIRLLASTNDSWTAEEVWKTNRFRPKFNDCILKDGFLYGLDDGTLCCLEMATGKLKWKARGTRIGYGQIVLVDDILLILSEDGDLVLVSANPDRYEEISKLHTLEPICWNHPAIAHGKLLLRNSFMAVCYELAD
ncbi:MAG: PQQ-binding-like beta-propeller repeat protein [Planctomycetaceae bacterium]